MIIKRCNICGVKGATDSEYNGIVVRFYRDVMKWICENCLEEHYENLRRTIRR